MCRDYFWVFCHPQNSIWHLELTDQAKVERPKAPGGMTGGVEFEAMGYLVGGQGCQSCDPPMLLHRLAIFTSSTCSQMLPRPLTSRPIMSTQPTACMRTSSHLVSSGSFW